MHGLLKPSTLLLLCICFFLPLVWSQEEDPCQEYTVDFQCDASATETPPEESPTDCGTNPMETTLKLFAEGSAIIDKEYTKLNGSDESILMIGNTGTGKSTLVYFLAGNDSAIIAYTEDLVNYRIKDCNNKIGDSQYVSHTSFPEAVEDSESSTAFFDYPGFIDNRPVCVEIANAFFMLNVAQRLQRAKIFIVAEHSTFIGTKGAFAKLLVSVVEFILNIKELGPGIGIVVTKVDKPSSSDALLVSSIILYFNKALTDEEFVSTFKDENQYKKAVFLIEQLLDSNRIGIFRTPDNCGPLSTIDLMVENKISLRNVMLDNVNFTDVEASDFSISLSPVALLEIIKIRQALTDAITESFAIIRDTVITALSYDCNDAAACQKALQVIPKLYADQAFANKYEDFCSWSSSHIKDIVSNTTAVYFSLPSLDIPSNVFEALLTSSGHLDTLQSINKVSIPLDLLYKPLQDLHTNITSSVPALAKNLGTKLESFLKTFSSEVVTYMSSQYDCQTSDKCLEVLTSIESVFNDPDFKNEYSSFNPPGISLHEIVSRTTAVFYSVPQIIISPEVTQGLQDISTYIDILGTPETLSLDIPYLYRSMQAMKITLKDDVTELNSNYAGQVNALLQSAATELHSYLFPGPQCEKDGCELLLKSIEILFANADFNNNYDYPGSWSGLSYQNITIRVTNVQIEGFTWSEDILVPLESYSEYLDRLLVIDRTLAFTVDSWLQNMRDLKTTLKKDISELNLIFYKQVDALLQLAFTELYMYLFPGSQCEKDGCRLLLKNFEVLFANIDFSNNYVFPGSWIGLSYQNIILRLTNVSLEEFIWSKDVLVPLKSYSEYLDRLLVIDSSLAVSVDSWLKHMRNFKTKIVDQVSTNFITAVHTNIRAAFRVIYTAILTIQIENIKVLDDIFAVQSLVTSLIRRISDYKAAIEYEFLTEAGLVARRFVDETIKNFENLGLNNADIEFYKEFNPVPYLSFLEKYEYSTEIKRGDLSAWYETLSIFEASMSNEKVWYNFLVELLSDLSHKNTQVDNIWQFKSYWASNGAIDANDNNLGLKTFWSTFSAVPSIKTLYINDVIAILTASKDRLSKFDALNELLKITLTDKLICFEVNKVRDCKGMFVSLASVISYKGLLVDSEVQSIIIKAYQTIYLDAALTGTEYNNGSNIDVYIISPTWVGTGSSINLNGAIGKTEPPFVGSGGANGKPGGIGGNAGNIYGIGRYFPNSYPTISVDGGPGGNGQHGQPGSNGIQGIIKRVGCSFDTTTTICSNHCHPEVWVLHLDDQFKPWTCNTNSFPSSPCPTSEGQMVHYTIPGTKGSAGGIGGHGGQPGRAGFPGRVVLKNLEDGTEKNQVGATAFNGSKGIGSYGGSGGADGSTYKVSLSDSGHGQCIRKASSSVDDGLTYPSGSPGRDGASSIAPLVPIEHYFDYKRSVPLYIDQFKAATQTMKQSKFFKTLLTEFINKLDKLIP